MATLTSLYLAPEDPMASPQAAAVEKTLNTLEVIGRALGPNTFAAGAGFSRHVIYAGCSPYLVTEPPADGGLQFCHVALHGPYPSPQLVTGPNTVAPRCPGCRAKIGTWREQLADWQRETTSPGCGVCGKTWAVYELDWREHAVAASYLIELRNVYPGEANPSDLLMERLGQQTKTVWRHAWAAYFTE